MNNPGTELSKYYIFLVIFITTLTGLLFGFDSGIISGVSFIIKQHFGLGSSEMQFVIDAILLGACAGTLLGGKLADYYGRRNMLLLVAYLFIIGSICSALSLNIGWLIIGRLIIGLAIGISSYIGPLYIAEIAPAKHRGKLLLFNSIAMSLGMALAYLVNTLLNSSDAWQAMLIISIFPAILLGFGILILPESPRWLAQQGWLQDARQVLMKLRASTQIETEWHEIEHNLQRQSKIRWNLFHNKSLRPVIFLGLFLAFVQEMTGLDTLLYYIPAIFDAAGLPNNETAPIATFEVEFTGLLMTIAATFLVDIVGRRKLILNGFGVMLLSLIGLIFLTPLCLHNQIPGFVLLLDLIVFIASYAIGIGGLLWLVLAEIFPLKVRGFLMGLVISMNWASTILITSDSFGILEDLGAVLTLWIHIALCVATWVICYYFLPETQGASLEKIENNLLEGKNLRRLGE